MKAYSVCDGNIDREFDAQYIKLDESAASLIQAMGNGPRGEIPILESPTGYWQLDQSEPVEISYNKINGKNILATIAGTKLTNQNCFLIKATSEALGKDLARFNCYVCADSGLSGSILRANCNTADQPHSCLLIVSGEIEDVHFYTVEKKTDGNYINTYYKIDKAGQASCDSFLLSRSDSNRYIRLYP